MLGTLLFSLGLMPWVGGRMAAATKRLPSPQACTHGTHTRGEPVCGAGGGDDPAIMHRSETDQNGMGGRDGGAGLAHIWVRTEARG